MDSEQVENASKNYIAKILGALWLFDGLLQFQPQMFGQNFVVNILVPNLSSQPHFIEQIVNWGMWLWNTNTVVTNTLAALLQIAIGILLLLPRSNTFFKAGLWVSIVWGIVVWLCGEGAGGLLTGGATFYTGAPGAVVLYILLAVLLLIPEKLSSTSYPKFAGWICVGASVLQLQPLLWGSDAVQGTFMVAMMDPVHVASVLPNTLYGLVALYPFVSNLLLALVLLIVGFLLLRKQNLMTGLIAFVFFFFVWWFGQDFGQLSTFMRGTPTDPNTAPLMMLLLLPLFMRWRRASSTLPSYVSARTDASKRISAA